VSAAGRRRHASRASDGSPAEPRLPGDPGAVERSRLWRAVSALGVAQIVSWGTLFYAIGVLGAPMRTTLGIDDVALFGSFTAGLFVSGIAAPTIGRRIDAHGGRGVLGFGSATAALACIVLAASTRPWQMVAGWLIAGVAMSASLYDPAFAVLHRSSGSAYRRAVSVVPLFGGFASTVFWPLSQYLLDTIGWRGAWLVYALLHAALCLPLHLVYAPRRRSTERSAEAHTSERSRAAPHPRAFLWLAVAFSLSAFLATALAAHLIGLLTAGGLAPRDAVLVGSLIGPMQVAGRLMEMAIGTRLRARAFGFLAFGLMALALLLLPWVGSVWILAMLFALVYGWSNGVMTIVRGTVPAELFGPRGYGELLGRLARPAFIAKAIAPVMLSFVFVVDPQRRIAAATLAVGGIVALLAFSRAMRRA
jgi:predicted MFS family arabinose efflux permease